MCNTEVVQVEMHKLFSWLARSIFERIVGIANTDVANEEKLCFLFKNKPRELPNVIVSCMEVMAVNIYQY